MMTKRAMDNKPTEQRNQHKKILEWHKWRQKNRKNRGDKKILTQTYPHQNAINVNGVNTQHLKADTFKLGKNKGR